MVTQQLSGSTKVGRHLNKNYWSGKRQPNLAAWPTHVYAAKRRRQKKIPCVQPSPERQSPKNWSSWYLFKSWLDHYRPLVMQPDGNCQAALKNPTDQFSKFVSTIETVLVILPWMFSDDASQFGKRLQIPALICKYFQNACWTTLLTSHPQE